MADDEDEFGLAGGLPFETLDETWDEIQSEAFRSTQHPRAQSDAPQFPPHDDPPSPGSDYGDDIVTLNDKPIVAGPPVHTASVVLQKTAAAHARFPLTSQSTRRSVQDLGEERENNAYANHLSRYEENSNYNSGGDASPQTAESKLAALTEKLAELESQLAELQRAKDEADAAIMQKNGETELLRDAAKQKDKDFNQRLFRQKKFHDELAAQLRAEIAKLEQKQRVFEVDHRFDVQDLKREATMVKRRRQAMEDGTANDNAARGQSIVTTPRKNRVAPAGDGFNDDDVVMKSPSKSREKSRAGTPRQVSKRKRMAGEASPSKPLPLFEPEHPQADDEGAVAVPDAESCEDILADIGKDDQKFKLLKRLMNHRPSGLRLKTLEAYTHFAFPSFPDRSLSSILYDGIALYRDESSDFPLHFCRILLSLWERCNQESYYHPLHLIIDSLLFVLGFETLEKTASLTDEIVPLAQTSAWLVAMPSSDRELKQHIDLHDCLHVLVTISRSCSQDVEASTRFWQLVHLDFIRALLLLNHPLSTLTLAIDLISTSILPTTIGPIPSASTTPDPNAPHPTTVLLNRLIILLYDTPRPLPPPTALWTFRLHLLRTLSAFRSSPPAAAALVTHPRFLGRLVLHLNAAISTLYTTAPCTPLAALLTTTINVATRLAYTLIRDPALDPLFKRQTRLSAVTGAAHAHCVALCRLAFMEINDAPPLVTDPDAARGGYGASFYGSVIKPNAYVGGRLIEAGIEEETVDMAHKLLDTFVSPQEGEELIKAFVRMDISFEGSVVASEGGGEGMDVDQDGDEGMDLNEYMDDGAGGYEAAVDEFEDP